MRNNFTSVTSIPWIAEQEVLLPPWFCPISLMETTIKFILMVL